MNKNRFYILIIAALFLSNVLLIIFVLKGKGHPPRQEPREIIIERLHFYPSQIESYDKLIQEHRRQIREKEQGLMDLKNRLYGGLKDAPDQAECDSLASAIGKIQDQIEHIHFAHFMDIKRLCKSEQLPLFNELTNELARLFAPPPMKKPPHD